MKFYWITPGFYTLNENLSIFPLCIYSMDICPNKIFISIWHFPVQKKIHKENIGTKRQTLEACLDPWKTFKIKPLQKYSTAFSYELLSLLYKLLYTEPYLEPNQTSKVELLRKCLAAFSHSHCRKNSILDVSLGSE